MKSLKTLEFSQILTQLSDMALSEPAQARIQKMEPFLDEARCRQAMEMTTSARRILDSCGTPPLTAMKGVDAVLTLCQADSMLLPEQLESLSMFASSCLRMEAYLKRAGEIDDRIASYGGGFADLSELRNEIDRCIRSGIVDGDATPGLRDARRKIEQTEAQIKEKLASILRGNQSWFADSYVSQKNGRYVVPVKKEFRAKFPGSLVDVSGSGATCFMEPHSVSKLTSALSSLQIDEDNEIRRVLYMLTAMVADYIPSIRLNMEALAELDFQFAKAKLSAAMDAIPPTLTTERRIDIRQGRHPLLDKRTAVPLDFSIDAAVHGVIITGPNTGGKTVAIKTVGLLSVMAQCGLHVPAGADTVLCMNGNYLCDIGDGQSISENLSTFSGHMKNVIAVLDQAGPESLVLLDELGSGTDPAEGMGIAVAVLEELRRRKCLFLVTTHYPQVKEYAEQTEGVISARMQFDRETLSPLYRLELGRSGESCALYIAEKLGFPTALLARARAEAYGEPIVADAEPVDAPQPRQPGVIRAQGQPRPATHAEKFHVGDSVVVYPSRDIGIVYRTADSSGNVGVQVKGEKLLIKHKRLKLKVAATELYPEDYDFSIVFDSVEARKARHQMSKKHRPDLEVTVES
ncbi:DNA mismatch repair protein MutS [Ruminococcaceae bacterium OttesenSCG-928-L11]|nr:DNA mismatch repair protein MutS [Ruminococcaceae bacterium OttesenSCG-928-L11]